MYEPDSVRNKLQWLTWHKIKLNHINQNAKIEER